MITNNKSIKTGKYIEFYCYKNPIDYGFTTLRKTNKNTTPKTPQDELIRLSTIRAKNKLRRLIIGNIYHYKKYRPVFLTTTIKENITDLSVANLHFKKFILRFNYYLGYDLRYITVPEFQKRGAVHYHTLILNIPFLEVKTVRNIWRKGVEGNIDIRLVNRGVGLFNYITKYLSKNFSDPRFKNKKRYFYSVDNQTDIIYQQDLTYKFFQTLNKNDIINKHQYNIIDNKGLIINQVKKIDFLYGKSNFRETN